MFSDLQVQTTINTKQEASSPPFNFLTNYTMYMCFVSAHVSVCVLKGDMSYMITMCYFGNNTIMIRVSYRGGRGVGVAWRPGIPLAPPPPPESLRKYDVMYNVRCN